jgi:hypothetical protein
MARYSWAFKRLSLKLSSDSERRSPHQTLTGRHWRGSRIDSYNWFEVGHLFNRWQEPANLVEEAERALAALLADAWSHRLATRFPRRSFAVTVEDASSEESLGISIRQVSPRLLTPAGWNPKRRYVGSASIE